MTGPDKPNDMIREDETVTPDFLRDLFSMDDDEVLDDTIPTHDGDWVREDDGYHFWRYADVERDYVNGACPPIVLEHFDRNTGVFETVSVPRNLHGAGVIPAGTSAPCIINRDHVLPARMAIKAAMKRLDEIEEFPTYEERWPWWRRLVRVWFGVEEDWIARHERERAAFYREID